MVSLGLGHYLFLVINDFVKLRAYIEGLLEEKQRKEQHGKNSMEEGKNKVLK